MARQPPSSPATKNAEPPDTDVALAEIATQLAALRADLDGLRAAVAAFGQAQVDELRETAQETASDLRARGEAKLRAGAEVAQEQAQDAFNRTADFVARQPGTAIGLAAGLGFLLGLLTQRR